MEKLRHILKKLGSVIVAYSGGLDSTFLLKMAVDTLGKNNVLAVTACSETYPASEYRDARRMVRKIGAKHITIHTDELGLEKFRSNPVNRCYYCKKELFWKLAAINKKYKFGAVIDGTNYDDLKDVRHGRKAAKELGVRSPLLEAKIGKKEIRRYSKKLGLGTWQKPSFACLASRIPFYDTITIEDLNRVDQAEEFLRKQGFKQMRVRLHNDIARLEFYQSDFLKILNERIRAGVIKKLRTFGFKYIVLDLEGYRTGSMHEGIRSSKKVA